MKDLIFPKVHPLKGYANMVKMLTKNDSKSNSDLKERLIKKYTLPTEFFKG